MAVPSGAVNPLKSKILACVGAISASVTAPADLALGLDVTGPVQNIGTCWM